MPALTALVLVAAPAAAAPLNDSGIQFCGAALAGNVPAPCTPDPEGQDMRHGADAAEQAGVLYKIGGGSAGRDYTKVSNSGADLAADATLGSEPSEWACTRDNVTGLVWEVKTTSGLRSQDHTYTWYFDPSPDGNEGDEGDTDSCGDTLGGQNCNTSTYAVAVNAAGLCGLDNWRVPTRKELRNLVDHGSHDSISLLIDPTFFPNTPPSSSFWSAVPFAGISPDAWIVVFENGVSIPFHRGGRFYVRLVHDGP